MLHYHCVSAVDEVLIGNYAADGACPVKAVLGGIPVEIGDGVETASCLCSVNNALASGFFEADEAVLSPEFNEIGGLGLVVSVKLKSGKISAADMIFLVGNYFIYRFCGSAVLLRLSFEGGAGVAFFFFFPDPDMDVPSLC